MLSDLGSRYDSIPVSGEFAVPCCDESHYEERVHVMRDDVCLEDYYWPHCKSTDFDSCCNNYCGIGEGVYPQVCIFQDIPCEYRFVETVFVVKPIWELEFKHRTDLSANADYVGCWWDKGGTDLLGDWLEGEWAYHGLSGGDMKSLVDEAKRIPGWDGRTVDGQGSAHPITLSELDVRVTLNRHKTITQLVWFLNYAVRNSIDWSSYEIPNFGRYTPHLRRGVISVSWSDTYVLIDSEVNDPLKDRYQLMSRHEYAKLPRM